MRAIVIVLILGSCSLDAQPFGGADFGDASLARGGSDAGVGGAGGGTAGAAGTLGVVASGGAVGTGGETSTDGAASGGSPASSGGTVGSGGSASGGSVGSGGHNVVSGLGGAPPGVPSSTCDGGLSWNDNVPQDGRHRPGTACMSCHLSFTVMGTVFPDMKGATNCYGVGGDKGVHVMIRDADDKYVSIKPNEAGNFYTQEPVRFPITVSTSYGSGQTWMKAKIEDTGLPGSGGDCNSCHVDGKRITPP